MLSLVDNHGFSVDAAGVEVRSCTAAWDERFSVVPLKVKSIPTEDNLRMMGHVGGAKDPQQSNINTLVGDNRQAVELSIGKVVLVRHEDNLRLAPVDHVWTFCPADKPFAVGSPASGGSLPW